MSLITELKRRNVFRVGIFYLVLSWLILQVADVLFGITQLPGWSLTLVAVILALGFIPALVFAWVFEMTPEGIKLERDVDRSRSVTQHTARKLDITVIVMLVTVGAMIVVDRLSTPDAVPPGPAAPIVATAESSAPEVRDRSIAVLPFVDMSQAGDQAYFADGISEEILNALTRLPELKVAGRTSSFKFRNVEEDLRLIGEQLGVANILEGSVRKIDNRVRVTVQLIDAGDGFHLWSETFDRDLSDIFAIQDEISRAVATALSVTMNIDSQSLAADGTTNMAAHDLYLQARSLLAERGNDSLLESAKLFEAATVLDPGFGAAWSGLARAKSLIWNYLGTYSHNDAARLAAEKALQIDPNSAEAHSVLAMVNVLFLWDWDVAQREMQRAIDNGPNNAEVANFAGDLYRQLGFYEQGLHWELRAIELDPLLAVNYSDLGWLYLMMSRCADAERAAGDGLSVSPGFVSALEVKARAQICQSRLDAARQTMIEMGPEERWLIPLEAELALMEGRLEDARELAEQLATFGVVDFALARIYARTGDLQAAAHHLELAYQNRDPQFVADERMFLPEDWPQDSAILAALDKPELNALYDIRRKALGAYREKEVARP